MKKSERSTNLLLTLIVFTVLSLLLIFGTLLTGCKPHKTKKVECNTTAINSSKLSNGILDLGHGFHGFDSQKEIFCKKFPNNKRCKK